MRHQFNIYTLKLCQFILRNGEDLNSHFSLFSKMSFSLFLFLFESAKTILKVTVYRTPYPTGWSINCKNKRKTKFQALNFNIVEKITITSNINNEAKTRDVRRNYMYLLLCLISKNCKEDLLLTGRTDRSVGGLNDLLENGKEEDLSERWDDVILRRNGEVNVVVEAWLEQGNEYTCNIFLRVQIVRIV